MSASIEVSAPGPFVNSEFDAVTLFAPIVQLFPDDLKRDQLLLKEGRGLRGKSFLGGCSRRTHPAAPGRSDT